MPESDPRCKTGVRWTDVEPGTHFFCTCGFSGHLPFCDGSHKGTGRQPVKWSTQVPTRVRWCRCLHVPRPPLCEEGRDFYSDPE